MNRLRALALIALVSICGSAMAEGSADSAVGSSLPPRVRGLLIQEMNAILEATEKILGALARGQDQVVAEKAQAVHDSFIMKQEMTDADKKALVDSVPAAFLKKDKAFHELSARLAEAARKEDKALQKQLFAEMIDACTACHSEHARDRFPGFQKAD